MTAAVWVALLLYALGCPVAWFPGRTLVARTDRRHFAHLPPPVRAAVGRALRTVFALGWPLWSLLGCGVALYWIYMGDEAPAPDA